MFFVIKIVLSFEENKTRHINGHIKDLLDIGGKDATKTCQIADVVIVRKLVFVQNR